MCCGNRDLWVRHFILMVEDLLVYSNGIRLVLWLPLSRRVSYWIFYCFYNLFLYNLNNYAGFYFQGLYARHEAVCVPASGECLIAKCNSSWTGKYCEASFQLKKKTTEELEEDEVFYLYVHIIWWHYFSSS